MPTALLLSPHLDDAVFSCGGTAARLCRSGWRVTIATAFTASMPAPRGFALACQTDKGIPAGTDYMALRRDEDEEAARRLGAKTVWLGLPEAPHRGYESADELFTRVRPDNHAHETLETELGSLVQRLSPCLIFAPQALGGHVDHVQMLRALHAADAAGSLHDRLLYYRDTPYALRETGAEPRLTEPGLPLREVGVEIKESLDARMEASAAYASQLPFQFGGEARMRSLIASFARSEGARFGLEGPAEAYLATGPAGDALRQAASRNA